MKLVFPSGYNVEDIEDDNLDINIILEGEVYFSCLFTLKNIHRLMNQRSRNFYLACDMMVLKDLSLDTIILSMKELLKEPELIHLCLTNIGSIDEVFGKPPEYGMGNPVEVQ